MCISQDRRELFGGSEVIKIAGNKICFKRQAGLSCQTSIREEIKIKYKSGNACCHSVQNLLSSSLLSKNIKIKIYRTIKLSLAVYGCEIWSFTEGGK